MCVEWDGLEEGSGLLHCNSIARGTGQDQENLKSVSAVPVGPK